MVFSSIQKVGVLVLVLAWCWFWFFSFSNSLLPALTSRNDFFINLSRIWFGFDLKYSFYQFKKVGVLVWVLAWCGFGFGFGFGFFSFSNSLLPAFTSRNDLFINLSRIWFG